MQVIPTYNTATVEYPITLNGQTYFVRTYWNQYAQMWFLDLSDFNNISIHAGLALVPEINILSFDVNLVREIGQLRIVDLTDDGNANDTSLGSTAFLVYYLPGEFETLFPSYNEQLFRAQQFDFDQLFTVSP